ncbi:hypothetical protein KM176_20300 [Pseudooceanicola sp. CBS1P-1]|uniref:PNPLA domain-containing protein n=1 Tax=Pseudooceanicola albus TaxID=2692189 RepID=A0A6L7GBV7_9RHOB|nr:MULTISPECIES: hypothetical protein [Pseudooceanicola]MBT9386223.1 hypothetical protein [Pseudooceanicola endophyticus]MXN20273.1 hypothetical protein [Pseudooceanicola albus]
MPETPIKVAIACQGGGAQTAFTAGALSHLLARQQEADCPFEVVALSGTSGGALCAALAWHDLITGLPENGPPMVERYWTTAYPAGNAAPDWPRAAELDLQDLARGRVPGQHLAAWARNRAGRQSAEFLEAATRATPFHVSLGLRPDYWHRLFQEIDRSLPGVTATAMVPMARRALSLWAANPWLPGAPVTAQLAAGWMDLSPWHRVSVLAPEAPPLGRRDYDIQTAFRTVVGQYLDASALTAIGTGLDALEQAGQSAPKLLIGVTDATTAFTSGADAPGAKIPEDPALRARHKGMRLEPDREQRADATNMHVLDGATYLDRLLDCLMASGAIPDVMRAVEMTIDGRPCQLWDGLYATNPPIYPLPDVHGDTSDANPEEIWVIRINPMKIARPPTDPPAIADRQNELEGNLSMLQEIRHVIRMGELGVETAGKRYRPITFGFIDMAADIAADLDRLTKIDTSQAQVQRLFDHGAEQMQDFLARWSRVTAEMAAVPAARTEAAE